MRNSIVAVREVVLRQRGQRQNAAPGVSRRRDAGGGTLGSRRRTPPEEAAVTTIGPVSYRSSIARRQLRQDRARHLPGLARRVAR
jgi:hypothetical protein